uniref:Antitoxin Phd_YefM, type II toxin-antitoxin system n=1 Tax=Candidatus Kentrum sp. FW TaxID=2126338 RepID=A0A450U0D1_9GAMM|nr:MAG: Antitoxin Phd_YefM, type II toxin-antitoxin system [Candidatus Kentron sp. FW]
MKEYNFTQARQHFAAILEAAKREGVVCIKKRNGEAFFVKPAMSKKSPFDIEGVDLGLGSDEIVDIVREGRERKYSQ